MRCPVQRILSECNSLNLPRLWRWWPTQDCEIPSFPETVRVLLTGFVEAVKVMSHTGLWDTKFASSCPSATHWIYSLDLPWRWWSTLDCEMSSSTHTHRLIHTGFANSVKVMNHTGREMRSTSSSPSVTHFICRDREDDKLHWTVRYRAHLIFTKCYLVDLPKP